MIEVITKLKEERIHTILRLVTEELAGTSDPSAIFSATHAAERHPEVYAIEDKIRVLQGRKTHAQEEQEAEEMSRDREQYACWRISHARAFKERVAGMSVEDVADLIDDMTEPYYGEGY